MEEIRTTNTWICFPIMKTEGASSLNVSDFCDLEISHDAVFCFGYLLMAL